MRLGGTCVRVPDRHHQRVRARNLHEHDHQLRGVHRHPAGVHGGLYPRPSGNANAFYVTYLHSLKTPPILLGCMVNPYTPAMPCINRVA